MVNPHGLAMASPYKNKFVLPKKNRLNLRREFSILKKHGRMLNSESFGFLYSVSPTPSLPSKPPLFNFIVSTKVSKKAVQRNLIKRRLSEIVRQMLPELSGKSVSGVFLCKKGVLGKTYAELKKEVIFALRRNGLINSV